MPKVSHYFYYFLTVIIIVGICVVGFLYIQNNDKSYFLQQTNTEYIINAKELDSITFKKDSPVIKLIDKSSNLSLQYSSQTNPKIKAEMLGDKSIVYKNVEDQVDLKYTPLDNGVKEDIILNSKEVVQNNADISFSFIFKLKGFQYIQDSNGNISTTFVSKSNPKEVYTLQPAFMVDKKNVRSDDVQTFIKKYTNDDEFIITLIPNKEWLLDKNREYPVTIDPTIVKGAVASAIFSFNEKTGQTAYDSSGNSTNATLGTTTGSESSDPTWRTNDSCVSDGCLQLDGSNDEVYVTSASVISSNSTSISFWMRSPAYVSGTGWNIVITKGDNSKGWYISRNGTSNDLSMRVDTSGGFNQYSKAIVPNVFDNNWHHIEYVIDNAGTITSYKDGNVAASSSFTPGTGVGDNTINLKLAGNITGGDFYKGFVDEVRIYDYARTAYQVKQDYSSFQSYGQNSVTFGGNSTSLSNGLVGYWKMEEASDATRVDSSGNGNNLTESASDTIVQAGGKYGYSGDFERGDTEYLTIADNAQSGLDLPGNRFTFSAWINVESTVGDYEGIITKADTNGQMSYAWGTLQGTNRFMFWMDDDGWAGGSTQITSASNIYTTGEWNMFTISYDGAYIRLYKNGVEQTSNNFPYSVSNATLHQGTSAFELGRWGGQNEYFDGKIDEVRVYSRALSAAEVMRLYNSAPGPTAYWDFNEGTGQVVADKSGNGLNGQFGTTSGSESEDPVWAKGKFGNALQLESDVDQVQFGTSALLTTPKITYSAWVKRTGSLSGKYIVLFWAKANWNDPNGWTLSIDDITSTGTSTNRCLNLGTYGVELSGYNVDPDSCYPLNTWVYITATFDSDSHAITMYLNGIPVSVTQFNGPPTVINSNTATKLIGGDNVTVLLDDVKIYNYVRTQSQIIEDMNGGHPVGGSPVGSQVGYWKFNEANGDAAYDWSPQGVNADLSGSTSCPNTSICPSWTPNGKYDSGVYFTGSQTANGDSHVRLPNNIYDSLTQGAISLWFKPDDSGDDYQALFGAAEDDNGGLSDIFVIYTRTTTNGIVIASVDNGTPVLQADVSNIPNYTSWHHLIVNMGPSGNEVFIDGIKQNLSYTYGTSATDVWFDNISDNTTAYTIGCYDPDGSDDNDCWADAALYQGYMDEVKVYSTPLTVDQVKTEYNRGSAIKLGSLSTSTPSVGDDSAARSYCVPGDTTSCSAPLAVWSFDEGTGTTAADKSGNGYNITTFNNINSDATDGWKSGKIGKAFQFDGTNDSVQVATSDFSFIGSTNFTIETWVKVETFTTSYSRIITYKQDATNGYHLAVVANNAGVCPSQFLFEVDKAGTYYSAGCSASNTTPSTNTWYHIVATFNDSTNTPLIYVNGVLQQGTTTKNIGLGVATTLTFASQSTAGTNTLDGYIDETRLYNYVRSHAQVSWSYNRGAPIVWYKFNECTGSTINNWGPNSNGGYISYNGTLTVGAGGTNTAVGNCSSGPGVWYDGSAGKYGASLDFDGTDDYVSAGDITDFTGNTPFSLSAWVKITGYPASNDAKIVSKYNDGVEGEWYMSIDTIGRVSFIRECGSYGTATTESLPTGSWQHITEVYDGTDLKIYFNGNLVKSSADSCSVAVNTSADVYIGAEDSNSGSQRNFNGQVDDVHIYNYALTSTQIKRIMNDGAASFN